MTEQLLLQLPALIVGLLGGGGLTALLRAHPERNQIYLLGAESAVKSLEAALAAADDDNRQLRGEVAQLRTELATEKRCREELERRLAKLETGSR